MRKLVNLIREAGLTLYAAEKITSEVGLEEIKDKLEKSLKYLTSAYGTINMEFIAEKPRSED